ncbi:hypothetical protein U9M48_037185 [Paspalum notatum var. saurae]|uniref:Uncharacterized protein n=1 Tax=Paspalum notatum var. saurae TaxID=547442 RepID=A0AAQ3UIL8_PASNO
MLAASSGVVPSRLHPCAGLLRRSAPSSAPRVASPPGRESTSTGIWVPSSSSPRLAWLHRPAERLRRPRRGLG